MWDAMSGGAGETLKVEAGIANAAFAAPPGSPGVVGRRISKEAKCACCLFVRKPVRTLMLAARGSVVMSQRPNKSEVKRMFHS